MMCKGCGREVTKDDDALQLVNQYNVPIETWHRNCKDNTLGIHVEEIIDTQDLFG